MKKPTKKDVDSLHSTITYRLFKWLGRHWRRFGEEYENVLREYGYWLHDKVKE